MKKILFSFFLLVFSLSLVSCHKEEKDQTTDVKHGEVITIKEALEAMDSSKVTVHGKVVQSDVNSYILSDGTQEILIYAIEDGYVKNNYDIGDFVKVTGIKNTYFNCKEIFPLLSTLEPTTVEPEIMDYIFDESFLTNYIEEKSFNFLRGELEGVLTISYNEELKDNDYMVKVGKITVGVYGLDPLEKAAVKDLNGKEVFVKCFLYGYRDTDGVIFASIMEMKALEK